MDVLLTLIGARPFLVEMSCGGTEHVMGARHYTALLHCMLRLHNSLLWSELCMQPSSLLAGWTPFLRKYCCGGTN